MFDKCMYLDKIVKYEELTEEQEELLVDTYYGGDYDSYAWDENIFGHLYMIDRYNQLVKDS